MKCQSCDKSKPPNGEHILVYYHLHIFDARYFFPTKFVRHIKNESKLQKIVSLPYELFTMQ